MVLVDAQLLEANCAAGSPRIASSPGSLLTGPSSPNFSGLPTGAVTTSGSQQPWTLHEAMSDSFGVRWRRHTEGVQGVKVRGAHELDVHPDDCAERRRMIDAGEGEPE
jgi:hypothetical protein